MKRILLLTMGLLPLFTYGQLSIFFDDFEGYEPGDLVAATSDSWTTWSGGVASEDAVISDSVAFSGTQSAYIIGNNGPTDLVYPFPMDYTTGIYEISMKMYVIKGAYYNIQQSSVVGTNWMFEIYFDDLGTGTINAGGAGVATFPFTLNAWTDVRLHVDLTQDLAELFIDSVSIYTWQWSLGSGGTVGIDMMGAIDIFAASSSATGDAEFYVDDFGFTQIFATGIESEKSPFAMQLFPNPSNGQFTVAMTDLPVGSYKLELIDPVGRVLSDEALSLSGSFTKNFDMNLPEGLYFLRLSKGNEVTSMKILVD